MKNNSKYFSLILVFILVVGLLLRFWRFWEIPFTYDELSALSRLQFDTFTDLIQFGVKPDSHPAGLHVFLYYWMSLFGDREIALKFPFLLAGLASIYLSYRIGRMWFNHTAGILSAAYMSSLQLTVMYSQIARPYVSGLFLTLAMVFYWSKYFFKGNKIRHLLLFIIFASLSTYNHYFSLLLAIVVGLSGLWLVTPKSRIPYFFSGLVILVLYIPHLTIFYNQLLHVGEGGIGGWLNKPSPYYLFEYLDWLFHYSALVWIVLLGVWFYGIYSVGDMTQPPDAALKRKILLLWFFSPLIVGYLYSVLVTPVLQYSMLIFSTPYLFILFFSVVKNISPKRVSLLVALVLLVNVISLVWNRQYYKLFYKQPFEQVVKHAAQLETGQLKNKVLILDDYIPFYNEYYFKKFNKKIPYYTVRNRDLNFAAFRSVLKSIDEDVVVTSGLKANYFQIVKEEFPYLIGYDKGFTYEQYTFAKTLLEDENEIDYKAVAATNFRYQLGKWRIKNKHIETDTVDGLSVFHLKPDVKYGPYITLPLDGIANTRYIFIDILLKIKQQGTNDDASLVVVLKRGEETLWWNSAKFSDYQPQKGEWTNVYLTTDLLTALSHEGDISDCRFETFVWNADGGDFLISLYKITSRPGNPYRYGLFYDFED
jgi:hypothetical protein